MNKRIACFHLYNDYSGSPSVLRVVLEGLLSRGGVVDLFTSRGGVLDELPESTALRHITCPYRFSSRAALTLLRYAMVQFHTALLALRYIFRRDVVFYINTILPLGPALAGRLTGKRVVYHYHENAFIKGSFYGMLARCMQALATEIVCVSAYQRSFLKRQEKVTVIPNAISPALAERLHPDPEAAFERQRVLMLGSLKLYKGVREFLSLAQSLPQFRFELVVNDTWENISAFITEQRISMPENVTLFPRQEDVAPFYNRASLVLNLSRPELFIETFGLTALEAMTAGLPVIVPPTGGIAEMVEDGVNGYHVDSREGELLAERIKQVLGDRQHYLRLADGATATAARYHAERMVAAIEKMLNGEK